MSTPSSDTVQSEACPCCDVAAGDQCWPGCPEAHHRARQLAMQQPCEECGADAGEPCRPLCTGYANQQDLAGD